MNIALVAFAAALNFTPQNTEVVVAPRAWKTQPAAFFAAREMTNFLSRAFGAQVPIVDRLDPAKSSIVLGSNVWSVAAGIDIAKAVATDGKSFLQSVDGVNLGGEVAVGIFGQGRYGSGCRLCVKFNRLGY